MAIKLLSNALLYVVLALSAITPVLGDVMSTMPFEVLQYNIFDRPNEISRDGQHERLQRIPESLVQISQTIDVVTLAEADVRSQRDDMLTQFQKLGFQYSTSILRDPDPFTSLLNGGVILVSKWPILREAQHVYRDACRYSDCLAAKGVKYARVLKTINGVSKIFNVFATHMQAWSTAEGRAVRVLQAKQMRQFINAIGIPYHEPLIFAGDFNVDNQTYRDEVVQLVALLEAHEPVSIGKQNFTSDPRTNVLVGRDGAAKSNNCKDQYVKNWGPETDDVFYPSSQTRTTCTNSAGLVGENLCYCPCCPLEWLDYVLYGQAPYQQPSKVPTLEAFVNQVAQFTTDWSAGLDLDKQIALVDLSDHYPVVGKFEFPLTQGKGMDDDPLTYHLDGCSTDSDCDFHRFRCYCKGANCYYQGVHTNGAKLDSEHPVNRNCIFENTSLRCMCGPH